MEKYMAFILRKHLVFLDSLMSQKGVYPYDYMDSFEKFNQKELPTKELFYSVLNDQHITNGEYDHARKFGNLQH